MHKKQFKILTILLALIVLSASSATFVFAALQSYAPAVAPYNLRDRFDTDLFTGSATYSYDIKVPKGTDDLTPNLSMSYSSAGSKDVVQRVGAGWQLNQDYIERDANFTLSDTSDDK